MYTTDDLERDKTDCNILVLLGVRSNPIKSFHPVGRCSVNLSLHHSAENKKSPVPSGASKIPSSNLIFP